MVSSGGRDKHGTPRGAEAPVSEDQDRGRQHDIGRGHPAHPQRRIYGLLVPKHYCGRLGSVRATAELGFIEKPDPPLHLPAQCCKKT